MRILMVCLGNICRSPLAHGILESKLNGQLYTIDSAGTGNYHVGEQPDRRSIKVARTHGIDISTQRARQFSVKDFDDFDRIYAMDESNFHNLENLALNQEHLNKLFLFMDSNPQSSYREVPDPYYGDMRAFEKVYSLVDETCDYIVKEFD